MKKVLVTLIALSLPTFALADATKGFYVQADAGHATVKVKNDDASGSVKGFSPRISAGYDFGDFRVAADYTHYKSFSEDSETPTTIYKDKIKFQSVGLSAIYDFDINSPVKPYVGARLGINRVSIDESEKSKVSNYYSEESYRKTQTGIGVMAGVSYEVTPNIALDAGYRYNYWGKFEEAKVHSHEVSAGVRVKF